MRSSLAADFGGVDDLAPHLATSCEVARCFAETLLADALQIDLQSAQKPYSNEEVDRIADAFADRSFSVRALVRAIVTTPSFGRTPAP
jgi:hypothetical protein